MMNLDWTTLIVGGFIGGLIGLALMPLPKIVSATYKRITGVKPTFSITGTWYSAEYDIKSADPDQMNTILVPIVLSSYVIYIFSERPENPYFISTIPILLYAFFRFLFLLKKTDFGEKSEDFFRDWTLLGVVIIWFLLVMLGLSS